MIRETQQLQQNEFDILVIGGGIYGASVCWDASSRGLSTALIEREDFGSATSAASLKIIHGGLRYLQTGNLYLMQLMKREQRTWLRIAPHLVQPISCWVPTYNKFTRSKPAFQFALAVNNFIDGYGNLFTGSEVKLGYGRITTKREILTTFPGIRPDGITSGCVWTEAYMESPSRLLISILKSAASSGAVLANYVEAVSLLESKGRVWGIKAQDNLTGQVFEIRARLVINCAGGWVDDILRSLETNIKTPPWFNRSIAFNLVTLKKIPGNSLMGFSSRPVVDSNGSRGMGPLLFALNWGKYTIFGTKHFVNRIGVDREPVPERIVQEFIDEINSGYPSAELKLDDIIDVMWGYLPMVKNQKESNEVKLVRDIQVIDHESQGGIQGLMTVVGVRYTLARFIAERTLDLAVRKLHKDTLKCQTSQQPIYGNDISEPNKASTFTDNLPLDNITFERLLHIYGAGYKQILEIVEHDRSTLSVIEGNQPAIHAEIIHAIRNEMAYTLSDIVRRRTGLAPVGDLSEVEILTCAKVMGDELNWNANQRQQAIEKFRSETKAYRSDWN
jgi:glycerol-3-phosphate dehydrogenase